MASVSLVHRPWFSLLGLALSVCVTNVFARFAYSLILPAMRTELGWTYAQAGWLNTANAIGYLIGAIVTMGLIGRVGAVRLFSFGLIATTLTLLATGLYEPMWWQSLLRILAGVFGAMSFVTAGVLTTQLFPGDAHKSGLAIALLYGSGGGFGIVLTGASLPLMLDIYGSASWPFGWFIVGGFSIVFLPFGLWSARNLSNHKPDPQPAAPVPYARMLPIMTAYACFAMGYIVYLTFVVVWMKEQSASVALISVLWMVMGLSLAVSPFLWRSVFARFASGVPMALILVAIAAGTVLPLVLPTGQYLLISAVVFGLSVFMAPGAITNYARHNLPAQSVGAAVSLFTVVFAIAQIAGPYSAGWIGDATGDIGNSLLAAAVVLLAGAAMALLQRPLGPS